MMKAVFGGAILGMMLGAGVGLAFDAAPKQVIGMTLIVGGIFGVITACATESSTTTTRTVRHIKGESEDA